MPYFAGVIDKIAAYPLAAKILAYIYSLGHDEVWIIIIITAVLFAFLVYRIWGAGIAWVLLFIYMISYVIYSADLFDFYNENNKSNEARMEAIRKEINKTE